MDPEARATLSRTEDHRAIEDVLKRYSTGIDSKDWPLFRTCFTEDCVASYGNGEAPRAGGTTIEGLDALVEFMVKAHEDLDATMHRIMNVTIEIDGDRATSRAYGDNVLVRKSHPQGPVYRASGFYDDDLVREDGQWRIARRHFTRVWAEGNRTITGEAS